MNLFQSGSFVFNSGISDVWKIECDALTDSDIETLAYLISQRTTFHFVEGVLRGGVRLANALKKYATGRGLLIVDDVYTTGGSMERHRGERIAKGYVVFARKPVTHDWIKSLFTLDASGIDNQLEEAHNEIQRLNRLLNTPPRGER